MMVVGIELEEQPCEVKEIPTHQHHNFKDNNKMKGSEMHEHSGAL